MFYFALWMVLMFGYGGVLYGLAYLQAHRNKTAKAPRAEKAPEPRLAHAHA